MNVVVRGEHTTGVQESGSIAKVTRKVGDVMENKVQTSKKLVNSPKTPKNCQPIISQTCKVTQTCRPMRMERNSVDKVHLLHTTRLDSPLIELTCRNLETLKTQLQLRPIVLRPQKGQPT